MSKNLIPQIATMLGVRINESFKLAGYDNATFKFTENRFWQENGNSCEERSDILAMLLAGNEIIIKLPWKPKYKDKYWTFYINDHDKLDTDWNIWTEEVAELARLKAGWVFCTKEEAKAALPAVAKAMNIEYKI